MTAQTWNEVYIYAEPNVVCPDESVSFDAEVFANSSIVSYQWNFGDGTNAFSYIVSHSYSNPGNYKVSIKIIAENGKDTTVYTTVQVRNNIPVSTGPLNIIPNYVCPDAEITFSSNNTSATSYWDFGDGTSSELNDTYHTYYHPGKFPVTLKLTNSCGMVATLKDTAYIINYSPVTDISLNIYPDNNCPGTIINFEAFGTATSYYWDFGDGNSSTGNYISHVYTKAGVYPVLAKITNGCGNDTIIRDTVRVQGSLSVSDFYYEIYPEYVCPGTDISFESESSATSCFWNFGDGSVSTESSANHIYSKPGDYKVTLKLTNGCGRDTVITNDEIISGNNPVTGGAIYIENNTVCPGTIIYFEAEGTATSYEWNFGKRDFIYK